MPAELPNPNDDLERRLESHGFRDIHTSFSTPIEVVARFPPDWKWLCFYERDDLASLDIYPAAWQRDVGEEAESEWGTWMYSHDLPRAVAATPDAAVEYLILRLLDLWRSGAPEIE